MLHRKPERWIAITVILSALALIVTLAVILGNWSFSPTRRGVTVYFQSCVGVDANSMVRYAGAPVGRVVSITVVPRADQLHDGKLYYVKARLLVDRSVEVGDDATFEIKQEGMLGAKFVGISPGSLEAPLLADGATVFGISPVDLLDLAAPGKELLAKLVPVADHLSQVSANLADSLPQLVTKVDRFLDDGDKLLDDVGSAENRQRLSDLLANLRVVSGNLKVVTTNAKAFTATLGEKPWRLFWGGTPNTLPTESQILSSDKPVPAPAGK